MIFEPNERNRYSRQIILPEIGLSGQAKLKAAKIMVVGAGGLGCPVLQYLVAAGVGTIGIIDNDFVELSNLHRQILYGDIDIGKSKAKTAATKLAYLNRLTVFNVIEQRLNNENARTLLSGYDIIIDGSDNFETRYCVNDACVSLGLPFVMGSILRFEGQVAVFNYQNGPTYRCLFPDAEEGESCAEAGVIGILPGIIGTFMANETIKIICNVGEVLTGRLLIFNALTSASHIFKFSKKSAITSETVKISSNIDQENVQLIEMQWDDFDLAFENEPENWLLVDIRENYEYESDHVGGINIPLPDLSAKLHELPKSKNIVFYCRSGVRSKKAASIFQKSAELGNSFWMKEFK